MACKETKPFSYDPSSQYNKHHMALEDTRYGSPFKREDYINTHNVDETSLDRLVILYGWMIARIKNSPMETFIRVARKSVTMIP